MWYPIRRVYCLQTFVKGEFHHRIRTAPELIVPLNGVSDPPPEWVLHGFTLVSELVMF